MWECEWSNGHSCMGLINTLDSLASNSLYRTIIKMCRLYPKGNKWKEVFVFVRFDQTVHITIFTPSPGTEWNCPSDSRLSLTYVVDRGNDKRFAVSYKPIKLLQLKNNMGSQAFFLSGGVGGGRRGGRCCFGFRRNRQLITGIIVCRPKLISKIIDLN